MYLQQCGKVNSGLYTSKELKILQFVDFLESVGYVYGLYEISERVSQWSVGLNLVIKNI